MQDGCARRAAIMKIMAMISDAGDKLWERLMGATNFETDAGKLRCISPYHHGARLLA
jgi:hypothetical protein